MLSQLLHLRVGAQAAIVGVNIEVRPRIVLEHTTLLVYLFNHCTEILHAY